jgi:inhibitor of KinA sporulation pathway (predicted exonuclease)
MSELIVVVDLEATCWTQGPKQTIDNMETIQIGAVLTDLTGHCLDEFSCFVKPTENPKLSAFCVELTDISQHLVDEAPGFSHAMDLLDRWLDDRALIWGSWGNFDYNLLLSEESRRCHTSRFTQLLHINLKKAWRRSTRMKRGTDLSSALMFHDLEFIGRPHSAIDDTKNTARLLEYISDQEINLQIANDAVEKQNKHPKYVRPK